MSSRTHVPLVAISVISFAATALAQVQKEFSDSFPHIEIKGGNKCVEEKRTVCLPANCRIDFDRTFSTSTNFGGNYGQGGPGFGVVVNSINTHGSSGFATYTLDPQTQCLTSTIKVCAKNNQRGWYDGYHVVYAKCYPRCDCNSGAWFDMNRDSCATGACGAVPGMPDGEKGGGYFAWQGNLFVNVPCSETRCADLRQALDTGLATWNVTPPAGTMQSAVLVTTPNTGWNSAGSGQWISHNALSGPGNFPGGSYVYQTTFCLCSGYQRPSLQLQVWGDNDVTVRLNGVTIAGPTTNHMAYSGAGLNVNANGYNQFVPGQNVLQVVVWNADGSPTGLRVTGAIAAIAGQCRP